MQRDSNNVCNSTGLGKLWNSELTSRSDYVAAQHPPREYQTSQRSRAVAAGLQELLHFSWFHSVAMLAPNDQFRLRLRTGSAHVGI